MFKAILSVTVLPLDGTYSVRTLSGVGRSVSLACLSGIPHYVRHPDTKKIVEALGAVPAPSNLFIGLDVGEQALCFPIKRGLSSRGQEGFSSPHQAVEEIEKQDVRVIVRLE